jgi:hypothetical protein
MDSLIQGFLKSARLGPVFLGMREEDVLGRLGPPEDVSVPRKPMIWKYASLQLVLERGAVTGIYLYFEQNCCRLPARLGGADRPLEASPLERFRRELEEGGIRYRIDEALTFETQITVVAEAGVAAVFSQPEGELSKIVADVLRASG